MGSSKQSSSGSSTSTTSVKASPEEQELNKLQLEREKYLDPQIRQTQSSGLELTNQLLQGGNLPGFLKPLAAGIDQSVIDYNVQQALRDIQPQFAQSGLLDSGVNAAISARTAADLRSQASQFNIGNLLNLAQLGLSGQAQVQQPIQGFSGLLSQRLGGLRSSTTTGTSSQTTSQPGFFQQAVGSFAQGAGAGAAGWLFCWVAAELYGGMDHPKTCAARTYIAKEAPSWFRNFYIKFGRQIASFIRDKEWLKKLLLPLFDNFAKRGGYGTAL